MTGIDILHASSIAPQILVSQVLSSSDTTLYLVGAAQSAKIDSAAVCNISGSLVAPALTLGATATTGGSFAAGTFYWKVTAKNGIGETVGSNEVSATLAQNGSQPLSWTAVPGAVTYEVYRGTAAGSENAHVGTGLTATSFTDTGAAGTAGSPPGAATNSGAATVNISLVKAGSTSDATHRVVSGLSVAANTTVALKDYIGNAMLGPGDFISAYSSAGGAISIVLTGSVHS